MAENIQKRPYRQGFIRIGAILSLILLFIALRLIWGIDVAEPARELIGKLNAFTYKLIMAVQEFTSLFITKLKSLF